MKNAFKNFGGVRARHGLRSVVHVGANRGQEMRFYDGLDVTLVEPIPELAADLRDAFPAAKVLEIAVGQPGKAVLSVNRKSAFSTTKTPNRLDPIDRQIEVEVIPLSELGSADCLVVDTQGTELEVLESGPLDYRVVIVETCTADDPTMAPLHDTVVAYMATQGFEVEEIWGRPYRPIAKRNRGRVRGHVDAEVRDVVFVRA